MAMLTIEESAGAHPEGRIKKTGDPDFDALITDIQNKIAALAGKLQPYEQSTAKPREIIASLQVSTIFLPWAVADHAAGHLDLAMKEARDTNEVLDSALAAIKAGDFALSTEKAVMRVQPRNGVFTNSSEQPVFMRTIGGLVEGGYEIVNADDMKAVKDLGVNNLTVQVPRLRDVFADGPTPRDGLMPPWTGQFLNNLIDAAHAEKITLNLKCGLEGGLPNWFAQLYPEAVVDKDINHFFEQDPDHPEVRALAGRYVTWLMSGLLANNDLAKLNETVVGFLLGNETSMTSLTDPTLAKFRQHLRTKYQTIDSLNAAWKTDTWPASPDYPYLSFSAVKKAHRPLIEASAMGAYDWHTFNFERFNGFFAWFAASLKAAAPGLTVRTHVKVESERSWSPRPNVWNYPWGSERESLTDVTEIIGCDTRPIAGPDQRSPNFQLTPVEECVELPPVDPTPLEDPNYCLNWLFQSLEFDLMKSVAPLKPIYDTEWHAVQTTRYRNANVPRGHMRAALRLATWHGLAATSVWQYLRMDTGENCQFFNEASITAQPYVMNEFFNESVVIDNEMHRVTPFHQAPRKIRVVHSVSAALHDRASYLKAIQDVYQAFYFSDVQLGLMTERMLEEGRGTDAELLILPAVRQISLPAWSRLQALSQAGTPILVVGPAPQLDNRLRPLQDQHLGGAVRQLDLATSFLAYKAVNDEIIGWAGVARPYKVLRMDGTRPAFVEARFTSTPSGATLGYAINLGWTPETIRLERPSGTSAFDIYRHGRVQRRASEVQLAPREYVTFNVA
ncbi:beta-galactosidase [Kribbella sp. CA-294648]|uniref:beta-galactosidase n=1 Tax=Kribbella sp. CA-294648 TaxID=3239948 RepID=UPI003D93440B